MLICEKSVAQEQNRGPILPAENKKETYFYGLDLFQLGMAKKSASVDIRG